MDAIVNVSSRALKIAAKPVSARKLFSTRFSEGIENHNDLEVFQPHDEKTCLCHMRTTKGQISLRIAGRKCHLVGFVKRRLNYE